MAAIYHFHRVPKHALKEKAFGVYRHRNLAPSSVYLNGFSDDFQVPVSRWTEVRRRDIEKVPELKILLESDEMGVCLVQEKRANRLYMFNHVEYDSTSLGDEYFRDKSAGIPIKLPHNYFPHNDDTLTPLNRWRGHAHLLFGNWINEIYQMTPYDLSEIGKDLAADGGAGTGADFVRTGGFLYDRMPPPMNRAILSDVPAVFSAPERREGSRDPAGIPGFARRP